tara:strand:+ start:927 stop:1628 length:702 start_codon:yes stop_codon:yes gene_type:complete
MGIRRGPSIVTEKLVYAIDVANSDSYVSGSTSLDNQITTQNNGVVTNGVGFDDANGGSLDFDGADDYIELGSIDSSNPLSLYGQTEFSIDMWLKPDYTGDDYQRVIDKSNSGSGANGWSITYPRPSNKNFYFFIDGVQLLSYIDSSADGNWRNFILTRNGNITKLYINSTLVDTETIAKTVTNDTTDMRIGSWNHSTGREYNGKISNIKIYHKELSSTEVLQNYNALKPRFGL